MNKSDTYRIYLSSSKHNSKDNYVAFIDILAKNEKEATENLPESLKKLFIVNIEMINV